MHARGCFGSDPIPAGGALAEHKTRSARCETRRHAGGGGLRFDRRHAHLQRSQALLELVVELPHMVAKDALQSAFELPNGGCDVGFWRGIL